VAFDYGMLRKGLLTDKESEGLPLRFGDPRDSSKYPPGSPSAKGSGTSWPREACGRPGHRKRGRAVCLQGKAQRCLPATPGASVSGRSPIHQHPRVRSSSFQPYVEELIPPKRASSTLAQGGADIFQGLKERETSGLSENFVTIGPFGL